MDGEVKKKGKESENLSQIIEMLNKKNTKCVENEKKKRRRMWMEK